MLCISYIEDTKIYYLSSGFSATLAKTKLALSGSMVVVKNLATYLSASCDQSPNQSITQRLNNAGEDAVRLLKSGLAGFIVNTTCKFL